MNQQNSSKTLKIISIIIGIVFFLTGSFLIYNYIYEVSTIIGQSDQSLIFWHLPILFIGMVLLITGIYFNVIAINALKGSAASYNLIKTSLKSSAAIFVLLLVLFLLSKIVY